MKIHVYGSQENEKILLLHPLFCSSRWLETVFERWEKRYCLIVPDLSGHGEDESTFKSADDEADFLLKFLRKNNISHFRFIYGASCGARLVMELIKNSAFTYDKIIMDGLCLYEDNEVRKDALTHWFLQEHEKARNSFNEGKKFLSSWYGNLLIPELTNSFMRMSDKTIENYAKESTNYEFIELSEKLQTKFILLFGTREEDYLPVSEIIHSHYPKMMIIPEAGKGHLEFLVSESERYLHLLEIYLNS